MKAFILALVLMIPTFSFAESYEYGVLMTESMNKSYIPMYEVLVKVYESSPTVLRHNMMIVSRDKKFKSSVSDRTLKKGADGKWIYEMPASLGKVLSATATANDKIITSYEVKIQQPSGLIFTLKCQILPIKVEMTGVTVDSANKPVYTMKGSASPITKVAYDKYHGELKDFL